MNDATPLSVAEAKAKLSEKIRACRELDRIFVITSHGRPRAVLMSYDAHTSMGERGQEPKIIDAARWQQELEKRRGLRMKSKNASTKRRSAEKGKKTISDARSKKWKAIERQIARAAGLCRYDIVKEGRPFFSDFLRGRGRAPKSATTVFRKRSFSRRRRCRRSAAMPDRRCRSRRGGMRKARRTAPSPATA